MAEGDPRRGAAELLNFLQSAFSPDEFSRLALSHGLPFPSGELPGPAALPAEYFHGVVTLCLRLGATAALLDLLRQVRPRRRSEIETLTQNLALGLADQHSSPGELEIDGHALVLLPLRPVFAKYAIALGKHPVTNEQYLRHMPPPSGETRRGGAWVGPFNPNQDPAFNGPQQPVVCTALEDVYEYSYRLSASWQGEAHAIPMHVAIWEFAAFGLNGMPRRSALLGEHVQGSWIEVSPIVHHMANQPATIDAQGKRSNRLGISDLIGNVWQWATSEDPLKSSGVGTPVMYCVVGGGFLDNVAQTFPRIDDHAITNQETTRHSDLGFRVMALVPLDRLDDPTRRALQTGEALSEFLQVHLIHKIR